MSRAKNAYKSASKDRIRNEGQQGIRLEIGDGHRCGMKVQIAEVAQTLTSTADLTKAGNVVSLEEDQSTIPNNAIGRQILLERRGNVYILRMWFPTNSNTIIRCTKEDED